MNGWPARTFSSNENYLPHFVFVHALQQVGHLSQQVFPQQPLGQHLPSEQQDAHEVVGLFESAPAVAGAEASARNENAAIAINFNMRTPQSMRTFE